MHRLETLLESTVDKSFDKFEIYVLRNILTVEEDVGGWVRLGHYAVSWPFLFRFSWFRSLAVRLWFGQMKVREGERDGQG